MPRMHWFTFANVGSYLSHKKMRCFAWQNNAFFILYRRSGAKAVAP
jgi:hypothetical protein